MVRVWVAVVLFAGSLGAHGNEALTVSNDSQAVLVRQGQVSPWLRVEIRQAEASNEVGGAPLRQARVPRSCILW